MKKTPAEKHLDEHTFYVTFLRDGQHLGGGRFFGSDELSYAIKYIQRASPKMKLVTFSLDIWWPVELAPFSATMLLRFREFCPVYIDEEIVSVILRQ